MTNLKHDPDASLADLMAAWRGITTEDDDIARLTRGGYALIGLTNFGERRVSSTRPAEVLGWPVSQAETLARQGGWATGVDDELITVDPERAASAPRRVLQIGDRRFGVTGCAPDAFLYAPLIRPSLQLAGNLHGDRNTHPGPVRPRPCRECRTRRRRGADAPPARARPARERLRRQRLQDRPRRRPVLTVPLLLLRAGGARMAGRPPRRPHLPIREAWDLSFLRDWRARMSALLKLDH